VGSQDADDDGRGVCVVIPTYDEAANIVTLIAKIRHQFPEAAILVVDDASPDGTADLVDEVSASDSLVRVLRRFLSRWGNRYAAGMLGLAVNDATSGFRAYSVEALQRMNFASVEAEGYGFQVEMTHRLVRCNGRIVEIPIVFADRVHGESKLSHHIIGEAFRLVTRLAWKDWRRGRRRVS
jgi:glycosyltransferase involved in cell wall biosynthesis